MVPTDEQVADALAAIEDTERRPLKLAIVDDQPQRWTQADIDGDGRQERKQLMYNGTVKFRRVGWLRRLLG